MNCGRVSNQLSAYVDRELTGAEMLQIRSHLGGCGACRAEYESLARMKMILGRLRTPEPRPGFRTATALRFEQSGTGRNARGGRFDAGEIAPLFRRLAEAFLRREGWPEPLGLLSDRLAAVFSSLQYSSTRGPGSALVWPRLAVGITTAALAVALIHTTLVWHKPPDALVATSPPRLIQGDDPLSPQTLDFQLASEGGTNEFFRPDLSRGGLRGGTTPLSWAPVSFQTDGFRSLP